jgi:hypothetical protein
MLFCTQAKGRVKAEDVSETAHPGASGPDTANRPAIAHPDKIRLGGGCRLPLQEAAPKIAHSNRIRLGGGCRLPLQGEPMDQDRQPRNAPGRSE